MLPAPVLPYSDVVTQRGATVTRDGNTLRIRVPPRPLFPIRSASFALFLVLLAGGSVVQVAQAWAVRPLNGLLMVLIVCLMFGGGYVLQRHHERDPTTGTRFELTGPTLTISADLPADGTMKGGGHRWEITRPAAAITEIRYNPYDHSLLIRAPGHNLLSGLLRKEDRRIIDHVAEALNAELAASAPKLTP